MFGRIVLWLYAYVWAWILVLVASMIQRRRMSHNCGVLGAGKFRVVDAPEFPPHEFFTPGREMRCRLRHAPVSYDDDTIIQVRAASLKLADSDFESPLDIEMNTGKISLFWSARSFFEFVGRKDDKPLPYGKYYDKHPVGLAAAKDGIRSAPSSFAEMRYHSQTVQYFIGIDGVQRYVKFRLLPEGDGPETGILPPEELVNRWSEERAPGETKNRSYLKSEYAERVARGPVRYRFQLQLHTPSPDDTAEIFSCSVEWDEATHPWMDVATVEIDRMLSLRDESRAIFSLRHCPPSLGLIPARSIDDYNSINYLRAAADIAKKARVFRYRLGSSGPADERDDGKA